MAREDTSAVSRHPFTAFVVAIAAGGVLGAMSRWLPSDPVGRLASAVAPIGSTAVREGSAVLARAAAVAAVRAIASRGEDGA